MLLKKGETTIKHQNYTKLTDLELITLSKKGDKKSKETLFTKYKGFLVNEANKLTQNCGIDFEDSFGSLTYLFLCAIDNFNLKGNFTGYMKKFVLLKIKSDIGKRKAKMPYVPKEYPFYLRNLEEVMIVEEEIARYE